MEIHMQSEEKFRDNHQDGSDIRYIRLYRAFSLRVGCLLSKATWRRGLFGWTGLLFQLGKITHDCRIEKSIEESKITEQLPTHKIVQNSQNSPEHLALFKQSQFSEVSAPRLKQNFGTATRCYMWHVWMAIFRSKPKPTGSNSKRVQALKHSRVALRKGPILAGCILWMNSQVEMCPHFVALHFGMSCLWNSAREIPESDHDTHLARKILIGWSLRYKLIVLGFFFRNDDSSRELDWSLRRSANPRTLSTTTWDKVASATSTKCWHRVRLSVFAGWTLAVESVGMFILGDHAYIVVFPV